MIKIKKLLKIGKKGQVRALVGLMIALVIGTAVTFTVVEDVSRKAGTQPTMTNDTMNLTLTANNRSLFEGFGDGTDFTILVSTLHLYNSSDCSSEEFAYPSEYVIVNNDTDPYLNLTQVGTYVPNTAVCAVYDYQSDSYITDSKARTIVNLLPLLVAVVLLTATAAFI